MGRSHRCSVAGSFRWLREVELSPPAVLQVGRKGAFKQNFRALRRAIASWCVMIDGTICRAHQKAAGARKDRGPQAIGRSRGG